MRPINFKEANKKLGRPLSMSEDECSDLPIYNTENGECISLWTTSFWKRLKFLFHGKIWIGVVSGHTQPPIWLDCTKTVFIKKEEK